MWASRRVWSALAGFEPLGAMLVRVALREGAVGAARWGLPVALVGGVAGLALARWVPSVPRGVVAGLWVLLAVPCWRAWRRVWARPLVALAAVDAGLGADAAVLTAAELALVPRAGVAEAVGVRVRDDARKALAGRRVHEAVAPVPRRAWVALGLSFAGFAAAMVVPVRPARARVVRVTRPDATAAEMARTAAEAMGAAEVQAVPGVPSMEAVQARAEALARALEAGMTRDEALTATESVSQALEESLAWTQAAEHQRAVDAALEALGDPSLDAVRDALARGDLSQMNDAVRALADRREAASQRAAAAALDRAAAAARAAGSSALGAALEEEASLLRRRSAAHGLAQALATALGETAAGRRVAEHLARAGSEEGALSRALDAAMREFDRGLSEAERRRVAQALAQMAAASEGTSQAEFSRAAQAMTPEQARAAMRALLESLRRGGLERSRAAQRARAGRGARDAMGSLRVRLQMGSGAGPGGGQGQGSGNDPGHVATTGHTERVRGDGFVAPVEPARDPGQPGVPVESVRVQTTGARARAADAVQLREAAPAALQGVEAMPVPAPWRDQVRVYFNP